MALDVIRPHHILKVPGGIRPEAVEGDVAGARGAPGLRRGARRPQEDLDVLQRGEMRGERRGGEEEEAVEDEQARGRRRGATEFMP